MEKKKNRKHGLIVIAVVRRVARFFFLNVGFEVDV